jgi:FkbM family methyltransferase
MNLFNIARSQGKDCAYIAANTLELTIEPTEMLFIDTDHHYLQLSAELRRHHSMVSKYIVFHDTHTFGLTSETYYTKIPIEKGLLSAVIDFIIEYPEWQFDYYTTENNGLTVIKRVSESQRAAPLPIADAQSQNLKRILIGIPTAKNIEVDTFKSIYDLDIPDGYSVDFQYFYGYNIDQIRNLIAHWACNYDYLFSVDSDIAFPPDTLKRLLAHDRDMVSGLYIQRKHGQHILEIYEHNGFGGVINIPYEKIRDRGLIEIAGCGFGCVLVKSEVFRTVGYPQFEYHSALDHAHTISEDNDFCRKARDRGFKIWADTDIQCRHIGSHVFEINKTPVAATTLDNKEWIRQYSQQQPIPQTHVDFLLNMRDHMGVNPNVIYDIGSNVLHWTHIAKNTWPTSQCVAFDATDSLEFLYQENNIPYNICLLSDVDGRQVNFYQHDQHTGGNTYYRENPVLSPDSPKLIAEGKIKNVTALTLDTLVKTQNLPLPDLIKMDVQGAELDVLRGATQTLRSVNHVILELQSVEYNLGAPLNDVVIQYMAAQGFSCAGMFCDNGFDGDYYFRRV